MDPEPEFDETDTDLATIGGLQYGGALTLSKTCKVLSVVALIAGLASTWANMSRLSNGITVSAADRLAFAGGTVLTTVLTASALAFFGFILEIGVGCWEQLWHLRYGDSFGPDDHEAPSA